MEVSGKRAFTTTIQKIVKFILRSEETRAGEADGSVNKEHVTLAW